MGKKKPHEEIYISVDIESAGRIPPDFSMLSLGACLVADTSENFYRELKPLNNNYVAEALAVCNLDFAGLKLTGQEPLLVMSAFEKWVQEVSSEGQSVFVGFAAYFDWGFVNYYFHHFLGRNPFDMRCIDIKGYFMGMMDSLWSKTNKKEIVRIFPPQQPHTHNALDDAIEQAQIFAQMLEFQKKIRAG